MQHVLSKSGSARVKESASNENEEFQRENISYLGAPPVAPGHSLQGEGLRIKQLLEQKRANDRSDSFPSYLPHIVQKNSH